MFCRRCVFSHFGAREEREAKAGATKRTRETRFVNDSRDLKIYAHSYALGSRKHTATSYQPILIELTKRSFIIESIEKVLADHDMD